MSSSCLPAFSWANRFQPTASVASTRVDKQVDILVLATFRWLAEPFGRFPVLSRLFVCVSQAEQLGFAERTILFNRCSSPG